MSDEMNVKISEIKAKFIRKEAELVDKYGGNCDGSINKEEGAKLAQILSGDLQKKSNLKKLAKESDDVKAIFGLTVSTPIESTKAAPVAQTKAVTEEVAYVAETGVKPAQKSPLEEMKARFLEVVGYDKKNNTTTTKIKTAYKQVKDEFKGKGKEYKEAMDQFKNYAKNEFANEVAQRTRASVQAYDDNMNIVNPENLQYDTSKKVYKREKQIVKANNNGDRRIKKALRNKNESALNITARYLSGNMSQGKIDDRAVAAGNRVVNIRENKEFTKEGLVKALGKDNPLLQPYTDKDGISYENVLVATGLITVKDGKYRVKELSKVVGSAVGKDNTLNDHDNHNESEVQAVLTKLYQSLRANHSGEFKTSVLKDSQVRDLATFLGYEDDRAKLMVVRLWQNIWKDAGRGAVAGGAAGAATGWWYVDINQHQEVKMPLEGFTDEQRTDFINQLKLENDLKDIVAKVDYGTGSLVESKISNITETAKGIYILQQQALEGDVVPLVKAIAVGAAVGAGAGAILGAIETIGSHAREREILGMVFDCDTTYEEILDTIDNAYSDKHLSPEMKAALKEVAKLGIVVQVDPKTGARKAVLDKDCNIQWDFCQFIEKYNEMRGNQILNAAEVHAAARTSLKFNIETPDCDPTPVVQPTQEEECKDCNPSVGDKAYKIPPHAWYRQGGEKWEAIVRAKYPCLVEELAKKGIKMYDKDGAIKVMQRALATDEDGSFHADQFKAIISGDIPAHLDFPDEISVTIDGKTITCKYEDNEVERVSQAKLGAGTRSNNGRFGYGRKGNNKTYTNDCYPAVVGEGRDEAAAKADFDRKVAALQKK